MSDPIQRNKLCEDVANHIIEYIRSQQWDTGMRLPAETALAKHFDVSRSTIRSAVKSLQLSGILYSRAGSGNYVSENAPLLLQTKELEAILINPDNLKDLIQTRYILEPQLAALAAKCATAKEIQRMFRILEDMEQKQEKYHLMVCGYQFHQAVAKISHNQVLYGFYKSVANQLQGIRMLESLTMETFIEGIEAHRRIAEAIEEKDAMLAKQLMRSHLKKEYALYLDFPEMLEE